MSGGAGAGAEAAGLEARAAGAEAEAGAGGAGAFAGMGAGAVASSEYLRAGGLPGDIKPVPQPTRNSAAKVHNSPLAARLAEARDGNEMDLLNVIGGARQFISVGGD